MTVGWILSIGIAVLAASSALAGPFTQIQVLLPGETAAPGTPWGKTGTPETQIVGVPFTFRVRACDDTWHTVTSITDIMRFGSDDAGAVLPADTPLAAGEIARQAVLDAAGSFTITVRDMSDPTIPFGTSTDITSVILAGFEFVAFADNHMTAGDPFATTIRAIDPDGNRVNDFSAPVELQQWTSFGLGRIDPPQVDFVDGIWSGTVEVYRADVTQPHLGGAHLYAYLAGDDDKNGTSGPFIVEPAAMRRIQIILPGQTALPGSLDGLTGAPASRIASHDFQAQLYATDLYWNLVTSYDVVRVQSSDAWAGIPMTVPLYAGQAQFTMHFSTAGSQTLTISDLTDGFMHGMTTAPVTVIASGLHHYEIMPVASPVVAGAPVTVTIHAVDADGNLEAGYDGEATLAANTGAGSLTPEEIDFVDGVWSGHLAFFGAGGAVQFTCADYATPPHQGTSNSFQVAAGAYTALQVVLPGQIPQGGTATGVYGDPEPQDAGAPFTVQVRAVDRYYNRVPGIDRPVALSSTDVNLGVPDGAALVNGEALVAVTVYRAGGQTIIASDPWTSGIAVGHSTPVAVAPGPYRRLLILAPGEQVLPGSETGRSGAARDQSINFAFDVDILATDLWWNPVVGVDDVVHLTTTDPLAEMPADHALADGQLSPTVRLSTGGYQQITVVSMSQPAIAGTTTQVRAINSGLHLEAELDRVSSLAGAPFTLNVRVTNDAGSILQEINAAVRVEVLNASTLEPGRGDLATAAFQLLQGQRTVTQSYTCAEPVVLRVSTEAGAEPALTGVLEVVPAAPAELTLSHDPDWVRANETVVFTARVTDAFGNANPGQAVTFALTSGAGELTPLDAQTDDDGRARAEYLSPRRPETCVITVDAAGLSADVEVATALVDPNAGGGAITNYPNPFHPDEAPTTIAYVLDDDATVRLRIYSLSGGLVVDRSIAAGAAGGQAGLNEVSWDGRNGNGEVVASGGYILHIEAQGTGATQHVMRRKIGVVW